MSSVSKVADLVLVVWSINFNIRDLISVDDDYVAEHEAKIMKEVDLQEKILEAVEKLREQIKQLRHVQKEEQQLLHKVKL